MKTTSHFIDRDRYAFDTGECSPSNGFAQIDTSQDAWYYGNWINPSKKVAVTYAEGDYSRHEFESREEMLEWVKSFHDNKGLGFIGIDPGLGNVLKSECIANGLGPYLH